MSLEYELTYHWEEPIFVWDENKGEMVSLEVPVTIEPKEDK